MRRGFGFANSLPRLSGLRIAPDRERQILAAVLIAVTAVFFAAMFAKALDRGFHRLISIHASGPFVYSVVSIISDWKFGVGNYVMYRDAFEVADAAGLTFNGAILQRMGTSYPEYLKDADFIDRALAEAFAAPAQPAPDEAHNPPYDGLSGLGWDKDAGYVDFVKLSFIGFGFKLSSLFYMYFALLFIGVCLFVIANYHSPAHLFVPMTVLALLYAAVSSTYFNGLQWDTVFNPRFMTTLGLIPFFHVASHVIDRAPLTPIRVAALAGQAGLIAFAMHIRTTTAWMVIAIVALAIVLAVYLSWRRAGGTWKSVLRAVTPAGVVVGAVLAVLLYVGQTAHPSVAAKGFSMRHSVWTSVNYGLQNHPDWKARYAEAYDNQTADGVWTKMFFDYLERHPVPEGTSVLTERGNPNHRLWDDYLRRAFLEFAAADPDYVAGLYFIHNPRLIYNSVRLIVGTMAREFPSWALSVLVVAMIAVTLHLARSAAPLRQLASATIVTALGLLISILPSWFVIVILSSLLDPLLLTALAIVLIAMLVAVAILASVYRWAVRRGLVIERYTSSVQ